LAEIFIFSLIVSQALLISPSVSKSSIAATVSKLFLLNLVPYCVIGFYSTTSVSYVLFLNIVKKIKIKTTPAAGRRGL
jgi:hypothetical protein